MRAAFLILLFPRIITRGRKWYQSRDAAAGQFRAAETGHQERSRLVTNPEELEAPIGSFAEEEPVGLDNVQEDDGTGFDLLFLRASLVVDGVLTMCAAFATKGWHIYLGKSALDLLWCQTH